MHRSNFRVLLLLLLFVLAVRTLIVSSGKWWYSYDEIIVGDISTQTLDSLFNTILSEPHPPGFYLLATLLPNPFVYPYAAKLLLFLLNTSLWILLGKWLEINKLLNDSVLFALLIFLSSFSVLTINGAIKQDVVSLPVFILYLGSASLVFLKRDNRSGLAFLNVATLTFLLFSGYIYYLFAAFTYIFGLIYYKFGCKRVNIFSLLHFVVLTVFVKIYVWPQFLVNRTRFRWLNEYSNNFINSLFDFLTVGSISSLTILQFAVFAAMVCGGYIIFRKNNRNLSTKLLLVVVTVGLVFTRFNVFVRPRYSISLFVLLCLIVGYLLNKIPTRKGIKVAFVVAVFLLPNLFFYIGSLSEIYKFKSAMLRASGTDVRIGLLSQNVITSYVHTIGYQLPENVIPLSKELPSLVFDKHITYEILSSEGSEVVMGKKEITRWLSSSKLTDFIYLKEDRDKQRAYDNSRVVMSILDSNCDTSMVFYLSNFLEIRKYENCSFGRLK